MKELSIMPSSIILKAINVLHLQSGFLPCDWCIEQLLSTLHEMQTAFVNNPAVDKRVVFLDISKAFDKVWHCNWTWTHNHLVRKQTLKAFSHSLALNHLVKVWHSTITVKVWHIDLVLLMVNYFLCWKIVRWSDF